MYLMLFFPILWMPLYNWYVWHDLFRNDKLFQTVQKSNTRFYTYKRQGLVEGRPCQILHPQTNFHFRYPAPIRYRIPNHRMQVGSTALGHTLAEACILRIGSHGDNPFQCLPHNPLQIRRQQHPGQATKLSRYSLEKKITKDDRCLLF